MTNEHRHPGSDALQAHLDGSLPADQAERVRAHLETCARCRSELEGWELLFRELDGLEGLSPSPDFATRVLEGVDLPRPLGLAARARRLLSRLPVPSVVRQPSPALVAARSTAEHLEPETVQDLLDRRLERPVALAVEEHLHGCRLCRDEVETWRGMLWRLDELPLYGPSEGFTERVMAHVRVQSAAAAVQPTTAEVVRQRLGALGPKLGRRAAALAGFAVVPAVTMALALWAVLSHPLVTPSSLGSFLVLQAQDLGARLSATTSTAFAGTDPLSGTLAVVASSPLAAAAVFALFSLLTLSAGWVFYRNVLNPSVDGAHVAARI